MKSVLHIRRGIGLSPQPAAFVSFSVKSSSACAFALQRVVAELGMRSLNFAPIDLVQHGLLFAFLPGPGVPKPQCREHMNRAASGPRLWTEIRIERVFRIGLGIFHKDIEISVLIENAGVEKFVLDLFARAPPLVSTRSL